MRLIILPNQPLRHRLPLHLLIQQLRHLLPLSPDRLRLGLAAGFDVSRERHGPRQKTLGEIPHLRHDLGARGRVDRAVDVERPEQARDGEEQVPVRDVHALADAAPRAEAEVVSLGWVAAGR